MYISNISLWRNVRHSRFEKETNSSKKGYSCTSHTFSSISYFNSRLGKYTIYFISLIYYGNMPFFIFLGFTVFFALFFYRSNVYSKQHNLRANMFDAMFYISVAICYFHVMIALFFDGFHFRHHPRNFVVLDGRGGGPIRIKRIENIQETHLRRGRRRYWVY